MKKIFVFLLILPFTSCAFMFNKSTVPVTFDSDPQGADVRIEGKIIGQTPVTVDLKPKPRTYENITLQKKGYANREFKIHTTLEYGQRSIKDTTMCVLDAVGAIFILPVFSAFSSNCASYQQSTYFKALDIGNRSNVIIQSSDD